MPLTKFQKEQIDVVINQVLNVMNLDRSDWDHLTNTLLKSAPVWPGPEFAPKAPAELAPFIDHTLLKPDATPIEIQALCHQAKNYGFASVCVNSGNIVQCTSQLAQSDISLCAVVGFPIGAMATPVKKAETMFIVDNGGTEVDMVINIGRLKATDAQYVYHDIKTVVDAAWGYPVKVILETGLIATEDIIAGCVLSVLAGATFVKTSTGFGHGGATIEAVEMMRYIVGPHIGVKASGGIRDAATATKMIQAGANRLGTSSGMAIVEQDMSPPLADY